MVEVDTMVEGMTPVSRAVTLRMAVQLASKIEGNIIEFGVADGSSTRVLRSELRRLQTGKIVGPSKKIYACDSFEGLPESFENAQVGTFACEPPKIRGVQIVKGYFDQSLTSQLAAEVGTVALASLDADLYSSTMTALRWLTPLLHTGSLLLFDEYLGENESEKRARLDWTRETGLETIDLVEFVREPSGWGRRPDRRVLCQVINRGPPATRRTLTVPGLVRDVALFVRKAKHRVAIRDFSRPRGLKS